MVRTPSIAAAAVAFAAISMAFAAAPSSPLVARSAAVVVPNPGLTLDSGENLGFGDIEAGNGLPDGWRSAMRIGGAAFVPGTDFVVAGKPVARVDVTVQAGTEGSLVSKGAPALPGETWVLRTHLDPGAARKMPVTVGIAFLQGTTLVDYALHRVETEQAGPQPVEIRATAPAGTDTVRVRWVFDAPEAASALTFAFSPIRLERLEAESRVRQLPLPHIFLVTIETFRADHASLYGYSRETTPNLAKMAAEGAVFTRHYAQAPYTRPSLSSLVTSRYPVSLGITENLPPLPSSAVTMAERLAEGGYVTGGFVAQFLLSAHYGFNQGFHYFYHHANDTSVDVVFDDLLPWSERHLPDNTFVWTHLFDPHGPYRPPAEFATTFQEDPLWKGDLATVAAGKGKLTGAFVPAYVEEPGQLQRRDYVARYDAELAYVDQRLGKLMDWIEAQGISEQSLVIVTADHGESMTDHGRYFCHGSLYDHDLHIPLVVWAPGRIPAGKVVGERTAHLDILPTILDYAGLPKAAGLKGASLRAMVESDGKAAQPFTVAVTGQGEGQGVAVYSEDQLTILVDVAGKPTEAYELASDPNQRLNLLPGRQADADRIAAAYRTWMAAQLKDDAAKPKPKAKPKSTEEEEMLRQLGYLE